MEKLNILIVDDEQIYRDEIGEYLRKKDFSILEAESPSRAFSILEKEEVDIVILDINLPEMTGIEVLKKIKEKYPEIEVIMITGFGDMNTVIDAFRLGAADFFPKPFSLVNIQTSIERTKRFVDLKRKLQKAELNYSVLSKELQSKIGSRIIGISPAIKSVMELMTKIAKSERTNVLITGESGTGKELVARGIHYLSSRKNKYFYDVNCSAVPDNLFESEFFGHKKGAFTGAMENKIGWFEIADKGTLFLDEIGDLQLSQQTKFLRVLEQNKIRRVGSNQDIPVDVRIIAATNRKIKKMVSDKEFREDLFYRLSSFVIHIPPLRERKEDILVLLNFFLKSFSKTMKKTIREIDNQTLSALSQYDFPGNIRELKNLVEQAVILCEGNILNFEHFPIFSSSKIVIKTNDVFIEKDYDLKNAEKNLILEVLEKTNYNKIQTMKLLNITRQSLNRRLDRYKINF